MIDRREPMVNTIITIPRLVSQFKKPALVVLVTTRALPLLPPRTPLQPLLSKLPARAAVYFPQQQQGGALGLFSPRQSILKPEWRLWWPFRWQGILRGQVSDEATRDLPKFVTFFLEKRVKVFCAHCLLYIIVIFSS